MKPIRAVFSIVPDCHAATGYYQTLWRRHFYEGLRGAVPTLVTPRDVSFDWARAAGAAVAEPTPQRAAASSRLWEQIQQAQRTQGLDAVISYCYSRDLDPGLVQDTIKLGIPWINFFCDSTHKFSEVEALARVVSLNWFPEHAALPRYRALGVPPACLPYALNPEHLPDLSCRTAQHPVAFIGLPTTNRITQLGLLRLLGCRVAIRGQGWVGTTSPFHNPAPAGPRLWRALRARGLGEKIIRRFLWPLVRSQAGGALDDGEFEEFLRASQIVLGLNQGKDESGQRASYLKFRDLEFPGYGCCYLTEQNDDVAKAFEVGTEVLTWRDPLDAARQLRELRGQAERVRAIGQAGRRRVLADHTWSNRLKELAGCL